MASFRWGFLKLTEVVAMRTKFIGPTVSSLKLVKSHTLSIDHL